MTRSCLTYWGANIFARAQKMSITLCTAKNSAQGVSFMRAGCQFSNFNLISSGKLSTHQSHTAKCLGRKLIGCRAYCFVQPQQCMRSYSTLIGRRAINGSQSGVVGAFSARTMSRSASEQNSIRLHYVVGIGVLAVGLTYASVPLYRAFCQSTGYGGAVKDRVDDSQERVRAMKPVQHRAITVHFNADTNTNIAWDFKPLQTEITVRPGETALAFYSAKNKTKRPIDGIATYNVLPFEAAAYFNKIQCFCFEEQRLNPGEEVDMPVFFYIDPDFATDPFLHKFNDIHLSYTFFESKPGMKLPLPGFLRSESSSPS